MKVKRYSVHLPNFGTVTVMATNKAAAVDGAKVLFVKDAGLAPQVDIRFTATVTEVVPKVGDKALVGAR